VADRRDGPTWVILELTRHGEKLVEGGTLEVDLRRALRVSEDWPIFVPSRSYERKGRRSTINLIEGYVFVGSGLDEIHYFKLETGRLVSKVMCDTTSSGMRALKTVPDSVVKGMRQQLNEEVAADITPGMTVLVTDGIYSKLEGTVVDIEGDHAVVRFELRSLKVISKVPKVFLDTTDTA
jgi:transcription antitermination factor NusG